MDDFPVFKKDPQSIGLIQPGDWPAQTGQQLINGGMGCGKLSQDRSTRCSRKILQTIARCKACRQFKGQC